MYRMGIFWKKTICLLQTHQLHFNFPETWPFGIKAIKYIKQFVIFVKAFIFSYFPSVSVLPEITAVPILAQPEFFIHLDFFKFLI